MKGPSEFPETLKDRLTYQLKEKGPRDPESQRMLQEWEDNKASSVEKAPDRVAVEVTFEIERAQIYRDAGGIDSAYETLEQALYVANQEERPDLAEKIRKEMMPYEQQS